MAAPTKLAEAEVAARLAKLPGWTIEGGKLHRAFGTGGTGALGQSIVLRFLRDGASVAVPWVVAEEWATLESRAADARPRLHGLRADVTDEAAMAVFLSDVLGRLQRVDVLVNAV